MRKLLVTRPKTAVDDTFFHIVKSKAYTPVFLPVIQLLPKQLTNQEKNYLQHTQTFDWLVLTSPSAIDFFHQTQPQIATKLAVVGKKTAQKAQQKGWQVNFIPSKSNLTTLLKELPITKDTKVLFPHSNLTSAKDLKKFQQKCQLTQFQLYKNTPINYPKAKWQAILAEIEGILFYSGSAVDSFFQQLQQQQITLPRHIKIYSIGEKTDKAIKNYFPNIFFRFMK